MLSLEFFSIGNFAKSAIFCCCCSRQSFLETNPHSRINKCWSESSLSGERFAGQKLKLFCLSEAACSLLKRCVHPCAAARVTPTRVWDTSCHQQWGGRTWLCVRLCGAAGGPSAGCSLLFAQHLLQEGGSGSPFMTTTLIQSRKMFFFSTFLLCFFSLGGGGWDWKVFLCRDLWSKMAAQTACAVVQSVLLQSM